jgi:hypothetical protein
LDQLIVPIAIDIGDENEAAGSVGRSILARELVLQKRGAALGMRQDSGKGCQHERGVATTSSPGGQESPVHPGSRPRGLRTRRGCAS